MCIRFSQHCHEIPNETFAQHFGAVECSMKTSTACANIHMSGHIYNHTNKRSYVDTFAFTYVADASN